MANTATTLDQKTDAVQSMFSTMGVDLDVKSTVQDLKTMSQECTQMALSGETITIPDGLLEKIEGMKECVNTLGTLSDDEFKIVCAKLLSLGKTNTASFCSAMRQIAKLWSTVGLNMSES